MHPWQGAEKQGVTWASEGQGTETPWAGLKTWVSGEMQSPLLHPPVFLCEGSLCTLNSKDRFGQKEAVPSQRRVPVRTGHLPERQREGQAATEQLTHGPQATAGPSASRSESEEEHAATPASSAAAASRPFPTLLGERQVWFIEAGLHQRKTHSWLLKSFDTCNF